MSHSYTKSDGTFPHKKDGGVLGKQYKAGHNKKASLAKSQALHNAKMDKLTSSQSHKSLMGEAREHAKKGGHFKDLFGKGTFYNGKQ